MHMMCLIRTYDEEADPVWTFVQWLELAVASFRCSKIDAILALCCTRAKAGTCHNSCPAYDADISTLVLELHCARTMCRYMLTPLLSSCSCALQTLGLSLLELLSLRRVHVYR